MTDDYSFDTVVNQSVASVAAGDIESACRLTGEALASYDENMRRQNGNGRDFVAMAALHCTFLGRGGMIEDGIGCATLALCTADFYGLTTQDALAPDLMDLTAVMLRLMTIAARQLPQEGEALDHVAPMLIHSTILLEHYLTIAKQPAIAEQLVNDNHEHSFTLAEQLVDGIKALTGGTLSQPIDGNPADPSTPKPILAEIIGHASALGLIEV